MKLLDQVRHTARVRHLAIRTEDCYAYWIERYIRFHGIRHPQEMGAPEAQAFLTHLAVEGRVSASTQNQALTGCRSGREQGAVREAELYESTR
jgi:hypothetical protein